MLKVYIFWSSYQWENVYYLKYNSILLYNNEIYTIFITFFPKGMSFINEGYQYGKKHNYMWINDLIE